MAAVLAEAVANDAARRTDWVSKTDVTRDLRCPYAWWLLDRGEIRFEDTVEAFQVELIAAGAAFHREVEAAAIPLELGPEGLEGLLDQKLTLMGVPHSRTQCFGFAAARTGS